MSYNNLIRQIRVTSLYLPPSFNIQCSSTLFLYLPATTAPINICKENPQGSMPTASPARISETSFTYCPIYNNN